MTLSLLEKKKTYIEGLDQITYGGLPAGRITLICGKQGCGKSVLAQQFVVNGARFEKEPGMILSFEESREDMLKNMRSIQWDVDRLLEEGLLIVESLFLDSEAMEVSGEYSLDGLIVQIESLLREKGIQRLALDTIEAIVNRFNNSAIIRRELARFFEWLRKQNLAVVVTAVSAGAHLTRYQLEEFVSDCVIHLKLDEVDDILTRKLVILKYRGSKVGMSVYPFFIGGEGVILRPTTGTNLDYTVSDQRQTLGVPIFDEMVSNGGIYQGSIILLSGNAGTGKSIFAGSVAGHFLQNGKKVVYVSTEESEGQLLRNFSQFSFSLKKFHQKGFIHFYCERPNFEGMEEFLIRLEGLISRYEPDLCIVDPVSNLLMVGEDFQVKLLLSRFIYYLRKRKITSILVDFNQNADVYSGTAVGISSLVDIWVALHNRRKNGKFVREISIIKARGNKHSNDVREFIIESNGIVGV